SPTGEPVDEIDQPATEAKLTQDKSAVADAIMFERMNKTEIPSSHSDAVVTESIDQETNQILIEMQGQSSTAEALARGNTENLREQNQWDDDVSPTGDTLEFQTIPNNINESSILRGEPESQYEESEEITLPNHDENATLRSGPVPIDTTEATFDEVFEESTENLMLGKTSGLPTLDGLGHGGFLAKIWGLITSSGGVMKNTDNTHNVVEKRGHR
ncbi:MAG: hypothetical protein JSV03_06730, partial [Planctomycetota bacterium]